jgi:hypothetical protein
MNSVRGVKNIDPFEYTGPPSSGIGENECIRVRWRAGPRGWHVLLDGLLEGICAGEITKL